MPEKADQWHAYFPQTNVSDIYLSILIGLSSHLFPKFIKKVSGRYKDKGYSLWLLTLQLDKPISLGWLLFSMSIMDAINGIHIGLHQKIISLGIQGQIKLEDQFKALHV